MPRRASLNDTVGQARPNGFSRAEVVASKASTNSELGCRPLIGIFRSHSCFAGC